MEVAPKPGPKHMLPFFSSSFLLEGEKKSLNVSHHLLFIDDVKPILNLIAMYNIVAIFHSCYLHYYSLYFLGILLQVVFLLLEVLVCFLAFGTSGMALSSCFAYPQISPKIEICTLEHKYHQKLGLRPNFVLSLQGVGAEFFNQQVHKLRAEVQHEWCFLRGPRINIKQKVHKSILLPRKSGVCYSCLTNPQIASSSFTLGTAAVLPFYTLMVLAPKAELTKKTMRSSIPYVVFGLLYAYLLYLSWTSETIRLMFASKYWLPEIQGIAKMFSSEMTLASAWVHLLLVDLFVARHVYHDGLEKEIETRHSVSMCLLFCPIGILSHLITTKLTRSEKTRHSNNIS